MLCWQESRDHIHNNFSKKDGALSELYIHCSLPRFAGMLDRSITAAAAAAVDILILM